MWGTLIAMAIVAAVLAITSPWDSGREGGGGPKEQFLGQVEEEMNAHGIPDSVTDCFVDGLDGELTDAEAQMFPTVFGPSISRAEAEADPTKRAMVEAIGGVAIDCAPQMVDASTPGTPAAETAALLESLR